MYSNFMTHRPERPSRLALHPFLGHVGYVTHLTTRYSAAQILAGTFGVVGLVTLLEFLNAQGIITP
jgi:hypothetical protein